MLNFFKGIFNRENYSSIIREINDLEPDLEKLSLEELKEKSQKLKEEAQKDDRLDSIVPEAFALTREAAKRTLGQRHFDVQLIGGIVLHQGKIAEMMTGEGKTLAATAPAYLNALTGKGVHIITVNDYLARRDAIWMGQIYYALGMSVGCLTHETAYIYDQNFRTSDVQNINEKNLRTSDVPDIDKERDILGGFKIVQEFLRPISRREAYQCDILYGTNHEFGFDYLRDNLAYSPENQVQIRVDSRTNQRQSALHYAIIDEVDSILIDEARTPLIIAAPDTESSEYYKLFAKVVVQLQKDEDCIVDEKMKSAALTEEGIDKVEKVLGVKNIYAPENFRLVHYLEESLRAKTLFHRDKNYVVKNGEIIIVDEFTGRLMHGRRYSGGLHQAIEAKEGVQVKQESRTYAQITIQNYFRLCEKIAGMTGTAQTSAEEFHKVYNLEVVSIPPNKPMIRQDLPDLIYKTREAKYKAVVEEIKKRYSDGQPMLIGTASIEHNELLSDLLKQVGIPHEVLNAKNHEREGAIIAQAGKVGGVTVATNMAGRGVDIVLGGNPPLPDETEKVREASGLLVIGTERHEARRIDNQLRGRSGRQGDPGVSRFFLSLEDDLVRIFGGDRIKKLMETFNLPEDQPIESGLVSKAVNEAQKKIEGLNFDARKHLLDYDDVLNKQRTTVYSRRQSLLERFNKGESAKVLEEIIWSVFNKMKSQLSEETLQKALVEFGFMEHTSEISVNQRINQRESASIIQDKIATLKDASLGQIQTNILGVLDMFWMNHLENMEALSEAVRLRAYGQHDPLVEYRREGHRLFQNLFNEFEAWIFSNIFKSLIDTNVNTNKRESAVRVIPREVRVSPRSEKVGRNDPCPCGAKHPDGRPIKYKHCHGRNV